MLAMVGKAVPTINAQWRCRVAVSAACAMALAGIPLACAAAWLPRAPTAPSAVKRVAVFGKDDRIALPAKYKDVQEKIGLLFNLSSHMVCTAFCVAPNIIATAGHCLHRTVGERPPRLADFWFARNYDAVRDYAHIAGHASGTAGQHVMSGSTSLQVHPPIDATRDWALVRLARSICSKGVLQVSALPVEQIMAQADAKRVFQISYHRDFTPWRLAYSRPCDVARSFEAASWNAIAQDFSDPDLLLLHTCDTGGASSGSPLLMEGEHGPEVIGINVGTYVQSKVLMQDGKVTQRLRADTIANTGVAAAAFADKLETFKQATILTNPLRVRELQIALKERRLYSGDVNGIFGPGLQTAIEAYERGQGLPATGLATEAVLQRLHGG
jgi:V8-like Glu-specific endopeptidase